jgi:hypothetical protein
MGRQDIAETAQLHHVMLFMVCVDLKKYFDSFVMNYSMRVGEHGCKALLGDPWRLRKNWSLNAKAPTVEIAEPLPRRKPSFTTPRVSPTEPLNPPPIPSPAFLDSRHPRSRETVDENVLPSGHPLRQGRRPPARPRFPGTHPVLRCRRRVPASDRCLRR